MDQSRLEAAEANDAKADAKAGASPEASLVRPNGL